MKEPGKSGPAQVYHADLWGTREDKYRRLADMDVDSVAWQPLAPQTPFYLFIPQNVDLLAEYEQGWKVTEALPVNVLGFQTHRDGFAIAFERAVIEERIGTMRDARVSDDEFRARYGVQDSSGWKLAQARSAVKSDAEWQKPIIQCAYRPFDTRWCYFSTAVMDRPRRELVDHVANRDNSTLLLIRQMQDQIPYSHVLIADKPAIDRTFACSRGAASAFPLYLYPAETAATLFDATSTSPWPPDPARGGRVPNLAPAFVKAVEAKLGLPFVSIQPSAVSDQPSAGFGPEDVLAYIYAIFHSPTYRARYAEFLKIDFPRVPLTADVELFWRLVALGRALLATHLLDFPPLGGPRGARAVAYPIPGDNEVAPQGGYPQYTPPNPAQGIDGRVYINKTQYFAGVPEAVWDFQIGGYQVCAKWLKDRRGRRLTYDELTHYQHIIVAVQATLRLMAEIDAALPAWPLT